MFRTMLGFKNEHKILILILVMLFGKTKQTPRKIVNFE